MGSHILIINGHPDPRPARFCAAICDAYEQGARLAGREVRRLDIGKLALPPVLSAEDFIGGPVPEDAQLAQSAIQWAHHLVFVHPLWLGSAPALLKAFCEQVFRYGFAIPSGGRPYPGLLRGRSARVIVTMGMPASIYRLGFGAFGVRGFERGILWLSGVRPIRHSFFGGVDGDAKARERWLEQGRRLGERGI